MVTGLVGALAWAALAPLSCGAQLVVVGAVRKKHPKVDHMSATTAQNESLVYSKTSQPEAK